jgi:photosystem II stability/assembly factor-like uncharacterized protein
MKSKFIWIASLIGAAQLLSSCASDDEPKTSQGSWSSQLSETSQWLQGVSFTTNTYGWAVGRNNTIINTSDGGDNWQLKNFNDGNNYNFYDVAFVSENEGVITGMNNQTGKAVIFYTRNGGTSWSNEAPQDIQGAIEEVAFADEQTGYATGGFDVVLKTTNGGSSWVTLNTEANALLFSVEAIGNNVWVAGKASSVFYSADGGNNWIALPFPSGVDWITDMDFVDSSRGWAVTGGDAARILYTDNSGKSWSEQWQAESATYFSVIAFSDNQNGWAVTDAGTLYYSTNGTDWHESSYQNTYELSDMIFIDNNSGFAVGYDGTILHYR